MTYQLVKRGPGEPGKRIAALLVLHVETLPNGRLRGHIMERAGHTWAPKFNRLHTYGVGDVLQSFVDEPRQADVAKARRQLPIVDLADRLPPPGRDYFGGAP